MLVLMLSCLVLHDFTASASVELRWDPTLLALAPGRQRILSIVVDDAISLRTIDVVIEGDRGNILPSGT